LENRAEDDLGSNILGSKMMSAMRWQTVTAPIAAKPAGDVGRGLFIAKPPGGVGR